MKWEKRSDTEASLVEDKVMISYVRQCNESEFNSGYKCHLYFNGKEYQFHDQSCTTLEQAVKNATVWIENVCDSEVIRFQNLKSWLPSSDDLWKEE